jgi:hypothetical protein
VAFWRYWERTAQPPPESVQLEGESERRAVASARAGEVLFEFEVEAVLFEGDAVDDVMVAEVVGEVILADEGVSRWKCHE